MKMLAKYYDNVYRINDAQIVFDLLHRSGGPLLDLGCGTGRTLVSAFAEGFSVVGIDFDQDMLDVAKSKLDELPKTNGSFDLIYGNMQNTDLSQYKFGTIVSMANTFSLILTAEDRIATLKRHALLLKDNGFMLFPVLNFLPPSGERVTNVDTDEGNLEFKVRWELKGDKRIFSLSLDLNKNSERYQFETAVLPPDKFLPEIHASGLELESLHGDLQKGTLDSKSPFWVYTLKKIN
ncbi:MAG: class I SAM-dependent methyltransferase [Oligoflexia bacterium]|nr:class I SAM-dependent methyltransferase [Oligoflexia bacterium]